MPPSSLYRRLINGIVMAWFIGMTIIFLMPRNGHAETLWRSFSHEGHLAYTITHLTRNP